MKKNLLFVIDSLECAGAEKSLVTLLSMLDYHKYQVDLMLFGHGGALEELVPIEVNILPPLEYTKFSKLTAKDALIDSIRNLNVDLLAARMKYSLAIRRNRYSNPQKAKIFWQSTAKVIKVHPKTYDVAIAYAQGIPTFYVAEKVKAKKKFAWVNVSYRLQEEDIIFQNYFYEQFERIVAVSESAKEVFTETFPDFSEKMSVIYDINHPRLISDMAKIGESYDDQFTGIRILTIGRLANQKGYDFAIEACKMLVEKGIHFRWYALGKGPLEQELRKKINLYSLEDHFILLGVKPNPYPYIQDADIYVQTSRFEGFGLAIAEARILNKPVVTTRFDAVYNQMINEKNGLVVDMESKAVYEGILRLIEDTRLRNNIRKYLRSEKKGNIEEIDKFYRLIDSYRGSDVPNEKEKYLIHVD
ncbi:glycosyltransferase [Siminovitchia sediminis]|uniref:Glycosyltransferase n=1 Tax=Siminovitchia sediminis TaxID=1274353 RepID=A0ABW4KEK9_9BACI